MSHGVREKFCRSFPWKRFAIKWLDLTGYVTLPDNRRVKIELNCQGYADHYSAFVVTVINTREGKVDAKTFKFSDYLDVTKRKDARKDHTPSSFHAWAARGTLDWYIATPADLKPLVVAIEEYIEIFE